MTSKPRPAASPRPASRGKVQTRAKGPAPAPVLAPPAVGKPRPLRLPSLHERTLANGLRAVVVRRPGIPNLAMQLRIPSVRDGKPADHARWSALSATLLSGTSSQSSREIAETLQAMGASLDARSDSDWMILSGSALAPRRNAFLSLVAQVLSDATFPKDDVELERDRLVQGIAVARSQPEVLAAEATLTRLWGAHPYTRVVPDPAAVAAVTPAVLRKEYEKRLAPRGSLCVIVGDLDPGATLDAVERTLGDWADHGEASRLRVPPKVVPGPARLVDRQGGVQTNIRLAAVAVEPTHPDYPALLIANTIFGGNFTSRIVSNLRERRGYTYSPYSRLQQFRSAALWSSGIDVASEVTAPALMELRYELARMVSTRVEPDELSSARRFQQGLLALRLQTQGNVAAVLADLLAAGRDVTWLQEFPADLDRVTADDVQEVAARYLAPTRVVTVMVGDAKAIAGPVGDLEPLDVG